MDGSVGIAGAVEGTDIANRISAGNESSFIAGDIDLMEGNDSIIIGAGSLFSAGDISNVETLTIGAESQAAAGNISGISKLTLSSGSEDASTTLTAVDVTATSDADTLNFGNYAEVELGALTLDAGDDIVKFGNYNEAVLDSIDFGDGNDTLTLGKDAVLSVGSISGLEVFNATAGAELWSDGQLDMTGITGTWSRNATLLQDMGDVSGSCSGLVYANEWDVYTATADGSISLDSDSDLIVERFTGSKWVSVGNDLTFNVKAGSQFRVAVDGDYADAYEQKEYTFTIA